MQRPFPTEAIMMATVLGTGTSQGVPVIGCRCSVCCSNDRRDQRSRCSLFLRTPDAHILIDTTPELRIQALREGINRVDHVLITHSHADHIMGFDDLRRFCEIQSQALPIYASAATLQTLERIFPYAFDPHNTVSTYVHATPHPFTGSFQIDNLTIHPLQVPHGNVETHGFLFIHDGRSLLAYFPDCKEMPEPYYEILNRVDTLILDGLRDEPHPTHLSIPEALQVIERIAPRRAFLTHLTHQKSHVDRLKQLPNGVAPAYDGLQLTWFS
ncbi:MAG: MBL fold metallo-hydrolase [Methylacidiphilales bacterium]|nr:MBL fold metallo-hydrolase [Candidatus Methylacidiphilales bacterium]